MSGKCSEALLRSLREISGKCLHSADELVALGALLVDCGVECWPDLVRAAANDFHNLQPGCRLHVLCDELRRAADLTASSKSRQHDVRPVHAAQPTHRTPVVDTAPRVAPTRTCERSRSPVTMGSHDARSIAGRFVATALPQVAHACTDLRPLQALTAVRAEVEGGLSLAALHTQARHCAVLGSVPGSISSAASGLRCWAAFCEGVLQCGGSHLPPTVDGLVTFSLLFRNHKTYGNYLSYIVLGCHLQGVDGSAVHDPLVRRAKRAIAKREKAPRPKLFLQLPLLCRLVALALEERDTVSAMFYIAAYSLLLRPRAEALPITVGAPGSTATALVQGQHSAVEVCGERLVLRLARRKNRPHGSVLRRDCWCHSSKETCPVHVLGSWLGGFAIGRQPFDCITAGVALPQMRRRLAQLGVEGHASYRLHDFRRGHAQDLLEKGSRLQVILSAGEWSSSAFTANLDTCDLEARAALEAHWAASEDDA